MIAPTTKAKTTDATGMARPRVNRVIPPTRSRGREP
jgi:hypothetical protein